LRDGDDTLPLHDKSVRLSADLEAARSDARRWQQQYAVRIATFLISNVVCSFFSLWE
jgi:hypothetical protein